MPISSEDLSGIRSNLSSLKDSSNIVSGINSAASFNVKDPIGSALMGTVSSINSLSSIVSSKIDRLEQDIVDSTSNTGKVKLSGNTIVITLEPEDTNKLSQYQAKIQGDINSINNVINKLKVVTTTLSTLANTAKTLKVALDLQETLLTAGNPVAAATLALFKKAVKILFYKDALDQYGTIIASQVSSSQESLNKLSNRFSDLSVQFVVNSNQNAGVSITSKKAEEQIQQTVLYSNKNNEPQLYTNNNNETYILKVESYGDKELVGKAVDQYSRLLVAETSPSFISTPEQLIEELKVILNK